MARLSIAMNMTVMAVAVLATGCRRELPAEPVQVHAAVPAPKPKVQPQPKLVTGSIVKSEPATVAPAPATAATTAPEAAIVGSAAWCAQRHVDAAEGRAPAGATIMAQKEAHDGICEQQRAISGNQ